MTDESNESTNEKLTEKLTWKGAWNKSPGPRSMRDWASVTLKGACMGTANIIPGVSGGTVALVTGIYEKLLDAISSADTEVAKDLCKFKVKDAASRVHLRFLVALFAGVGIAMITISSGMSYLMKNHPVHTWASFAGLIAASIFIVSKEVKDWKCPCNYGSLIVGTIVAYVVTGLIPVNTPDGHWFIFLCGMIAVSAMILPGISGSFLLLILGKYEYVMNALNGFKDFDLSGLPVLGIFGLGCVAGIILFTRLINWCLKHFHEATMAGLMGFMVGAMRKIWPWKNDITELEIDGVLTKIPEGKLQENILPESFNSEVIIAIALALGFFVAVMLLEKLSGNGKEESA